MRRMVGIALATALLACMPLAGCGPSEQEQYTEKTAAITNEWNAIVDRWNATPGDAKVATDFALLMGRAQAIQPPADLAEAHKLFLKAMEIESNSFNVWAVGAREESSRLHELSLEAIKTYQKELKSRGLLK